MGLRTRVRGLDAVPALGEKTRMMLTPLLPLRRAAALFAFSALALAAPVLSHAAGPASAWQQVDNWAHLPAGTKWTMMTAVDIDSHGTIYVLQRGAPNQVMVFDPAGKLLRIWGQNTFPNAHGLRVDHEDNVWVTDRKLQQVLKYSPDGKLLLELGTKNVSGDNESTTAFNGAADVAFAPDGTIFVADGEGKNTRIVKFSKDGKFMKFWGTKGTGPGQLDTPHSIVMDSKGRLYVANRGNKRVEIFDQEGKYLDVIDNVGTPFGLFMTKADVLYTDDGTEGKDDVTIVNPFTKKILGHFGGLTGPHMLTVDAAGDVYVAESRGASIKKFAPKP